MISDAMIIDKNSREFIVRKMIANQLWIIIDDIFIALKDFDGKKIVLKNGEMSAKFNLAMKEFTEESTTPIMTTNIYISNYANSLYLTVRKRVKFGSLSDGMDDHHATAMRYYLGEAEEGVFSYNKSLRVRANQDINQTLSQDIKTIKDQIERYQDMREKLRKLKNSLPSWADIEA